MSDNMPETRPDQTGPAAKESQAASDKSQAADKNAQAASEKSQSKSQPPTKEEVRQFAMQENKSPDDFD